MRDVVRAAFVEFTSPMEGVVPWMYLDLKGLVTTAIGNLIDPVQIALPLPWVHMDGSPASRAEIATEWMRVHGDPVAAKRGHLYTKGITSLRLTDEGVQMVVSRRLSQMDQYLASRFGQEYEEWPADAQLATLSMSWACGPAFRFPALEAALRARDFRAASIHCHMNEAGNPGLVPRNRCNVTLYRNADKVQMGKLDPSHLDWVNDVSLGEAATPPDLSVYDAEPVRLNESTASLPTTWPGPPDDEPPAAA